MKWETLPLGDVIDIKHGYAFKGEHFSNSGEYVLLTPGNCNESGGLKLRGEKEKYYVGEIPTEYILGRGDLLVVMTDLVGTAPMLGGAFVIPTDDRFLHNQRLGLVTVTDDSKINAQFLYYLLNTYEYRAQIRGSASGATVRHTSPGRIRAAMVRIPLDIANQKSIARVLSEYDDLIENNRRRIQLLENSARLLFDEWFVRFQFPGGKGTATEGSLPTGWSQVPLINVTTKIGSGATPRGGDASYINAGVALIRSQNVYDYNFLDEGLAYIDSDQAARLDVVTVEPDDILLNITGASVARCCMAPRRHLPARVNQHVMIIRADPEKIDPYYLLCTFNSAARKRQLLSYAQTGSTREALTKNLMSQFEVVLPDPATLAQFGKITADIFRQREVLAEQVAKLKLARDLLLPRLMSGEIEV